MFSVWRRAVMELETLRRDFGLLEKERDDALSERNWARTERDEALSQLDRRRLAQLQARAALLDRLKNNPPRSGRYDQMKAERDALRDRLKNIRRVLDTVTRGLP